LAIFMLNKKNKNRNRNIFFITFIKNYYFGTGRDIGGYQSNFIC
jgi:hypothetical protein